MRRVEEALKTTLHGLPVLTIFGAKNDPAHWQDRWARTFPEATTVVVPNAHQFPQSNDPDRVAAAVATWWTDAVQQP
jgi:predicted alpha/beta hydrolase family esterase